MTTIGSVAPVAPGLELQGALVVGDRPRPIFIIGAPRSGTSITTWVLGQHPNIQPMPETGWISSMAVGAYLSHVKGSERGRFSHLSNVEHPLDPFMARVAESIHAIVNDVFAQRCLNFYGEKSRQPGWTLKGKQLENPLQIRRSGSDPKRRWIDGTPLNTYFIWALNALFPDALFIHNIRRPDEVATSLEGFDRVGAEPQALEAGLETWIAHTENAWHAERGLGSRRVFRLVFERIADEPEKLFAEVCDFLGEEFTTDCLLPLRRKLNSSEVDDNRQKNLLLLRENQTFRRAEATYRTVMARPGTAQPDPAAVEVLKQRFMDYCRDRSLV
ncbi:sulfotransferase family protein [Lysobacter fragariae]